MRSRKCSFESKDALNSVTAQDRIEEAPAGPEAANPTPLSSGATGMPNVEGRTSARKRLKGRDGDEIISSSSSLWKRDSTLPSWNQCYKCEFMFCGTYFGPVNASVSILGVANECFIRLL
jgi:hypothetical protein